MKKIIVQPILIPTNEKSHIYKNNFPGPTNNYCTLGYVNGELDPSDLEQFPFQSATQNIFLYFVANEKIEPNDWFINSNGIWKHNGEVEPDKSAVKIIATNDPSCDGVYMLSKYFLSGYVILTNKRENENATHYAEIDENGEVNIDYIKPNYDLDDIYLFMQYYHEYCQTNGYVTPQDWVVYHKHF